MEESEYIRKFTISSSMEGLKECLEIACEIKNHFNFGPEKDFAFQTVLTESVTNAITHGNKMNADLETIVTIKVDRSKITIEVEDQGEGFDLEKIPSPLDRHHINLENGRGIFFIKQLSNGIQTKGKGNIVDIIINR
jgi:serine/threonine-protein kinase RsbW